MNKLNELEKIVKIHGYAVFPIDVKSKRPLTGRGFKDASKNWEIIRNWMRRHPGCGWAIPTGGVSGLAVIDLDHKHDGPSNWDRMVAENGNDDPVTVAETTQNDGIHKYYRMNGHDLASGSNLGKRNKADKTGIDIRANGGYIVCALTDGYEWINDFDTPLADIPAWVVAMVKKPKPVSGNVDEPIAIGRIDRTIPEGERSNNLYGQARDLIRGGFTKVAVIAALSAIRDNNMEPGTHPVPDSELETIYRSALMRTEVSRKETLADFTELGNAQMFVQRYKHRIKYCPSFGWLKFEGTHWEADAEMDVKKLAQESAQAIYGIAATSENSEDAKNWGDWAKKSLSRNAIINSLELARPWLSENADKFDVHPDLLNLDNGILNLETGVLMPHNSALLITQKANMSFDPDAKCPKWEAAIDLIFQGDKDIIKYVQAAMGWSMGGRTDIKALFFLYGPSGDNGKSTMMQTMLNLMGTYGHKANINAVMETNRNSLSPDKALFRGKRFIVASEIKAGHRLDTSLIKDLTGNDTISAEQKYRDPFTFKPTHKLWIYGNDKPSVDDDGDAIWNRIKGIPFGHKIPKDKQIRMDDLLETFAMEAPGILNWLLVGYERASKDDYLTNNEPETVTRFVEEYRYESDSLGQFIEEECVTDFTYSIGKNELRGEYNRWLRLNGLDEVSPKKLTQSLAKKGITIGGASRSKFNGIAIKE